MEGEFMRKTNSKAFTLVETLIMVGVIGIIAIIAIVSLRNMRPDKDYTMIRKAYSEIAKAVATLANDDELYPVQKTAYKNGEQDKYLAALKNRQLALDYAYCAGYETYGVDYYWGRCSAIGAVQYCYNGWTKGGKNYCTCNDSNTDCNGQLWNHAKCGCDCKNDCPAGYGRDSHCNCSVCSPCQNGGQLIANTCMCNCTNTCPDGQIRRSDCSCYNPGSGSGSGSSSSSSSSGGVGYCLVGDYEACTQVGGTFNQSTCKCTFPNGYNGDCSDLRNQLDNWNTNGVTISKLDNLLKNLFPSRKVMLARTDLQTEQRLIDDVNSSCALPATSTSSYSTSTSSGNNYQYSCCGWMMIDEVASDYAFGGGTCHYLGAGNGWILFCPFGTTKQGCQCVSSSSSSSSSSSGSSSSSSGSSKDGLTLRTTDGFTDQIWEASGCNSGIDCSAHPENDACRTGGGDPNPDPCAANPTACLQDISIPTENPDDIGTSTPNGDNKNGSADYTLPNFQAGSRGNVFTNTTLPANHPSDMKTTNKFAYSFASLFDTKSSSCDSTSCSFVTKDGMSWTIKDRFTESTKDALIYVDINGKKGPNSRTGMNIDEFRFRVDAGGAIYVFGRSEDADVQKAMKALTSRKFRKEDDNTSGKGYANNGILPREIATDEKMQVDPDEYERPKGKF